MEPRARNHGGLNSESWSKGALYILIISFVLEGCVVIEVRQEKPKPPPEKPTHKTSPPSIPPKTPAPKPEREDDSVETAFKIASRFDIDVRELNALEEKFEANVSPTAAAASWKELWEENETFGAKISVLIDYKHRKDVRWTPQLEDRYQRYLADYKERKERLIAIKEKYMSNATAN